MMDGEPGDAYRPSGCTWGCLALIATGLILLILGAEVFGRLSASLVFTFGLVRALRERSYGWVFSEGTIQRQAQPRRFWSLIALNAAFALASVWMLIEEVQKALG